MTTYHSDGSAQSQAGAALRPQTDSRGPNLTLWDIEAGLHQLMEARDEAEDDPGRAAVDQAIAEYVNREVQKVDQIRAYLRHCDVMAKSAKEEAARQTQRAQAWEKRAERLRAFCLSALQIFGRTSVEGKTGKLRIRQNGGKVPLIIANEAQIPSEYKPAVVSYPVDKDAIRAALEQGTEVPGATLGERGVHLQVT